MASDTLQVHLIIHPSTNGVIEHAVQSMKKVLKSAANETRIMQTRFLMSNCSIPYSKQERPQLTFS